MFPDLSTFFSLLLQQTPLGDCIYCFLFAIELSWFSLLRWLDIFYSFWLIHFSCFLIWINIFLIIFLAVLIFLLNLLYILNLITEAQLLFLGFNRVLLLEHHVQVEIVDVGVHFAFSDICFCLTLQFLFVGASASVFVVFIKVFNEFGHHVKLLFGALWQPPSKNYFEPVLELISNYEEVVSKSISLLLFEAPRDQLPFILDVPELFKLCKVLLELFTCKRWTWWSFLRLLNLLIFLFLLLGDIVQIWGSIIHITSFISILFLDNKFGFFLWWLRIKLNNSIIKLLE